MKVKHAAAVLKKAKSEVEVAEQRARDSDTKAKQARQEARLFKQNLKRLRKSARQARRAAEEMETLATEAQEQLRESRKILKRLLKKAAKRRNAPITRKKQPAGKRIVAKTRTVGDTRLSTGKTRRTAALKQSTIPRQKNRSTRSKVAAKLKPGPASATPVVERIESNISDTMRIQTSPDPAASNP